MATAMPLPLIIAERMVVVLPPEIEGEFGKGNTVSFLSIAFGFFNLADQAGLHSSPFKAKEHHANCVVLFLITPDIRSIPTQALSS